MTERERPERLTQNRVVAMFTDAARPDYFGDTGTGLEVSRHCRLKLADLKQATMEELLTGRGRLVVRSESVPMEQGAL